MPKLIVRPLGAIGVEIAAPLPLASPVAGDEWKKIAADSLIYAFAGRAVWFIADDERATEWAFPDTLGEQTEAHVDGTLYRFAFTERCSPETLASLVGTGDFHWDAVWIAALDRDDESRLTELIRVCAINAADGVPQTDIEVVLPIADGYGLWWLNYQHSEHDVFTKFSNIAQSVGWSVETDVSDDAPAAGA